MTHVTATPLYVQADPDAVFGFFHAARVETRGPAILICPPFGWDDIGSYRPRREWAEQLAAAGHPVLRFDLPGAGDSAGGPRDPRRLDAWTAAVAATAARLRDVSGLSRVAVIGTGLGGLVALRAACEGAPVDDFVLWGVPARGKTLIRELRAFSRLEQVESSDPGRDDLVPDGGLEAAGFLLSPETVTDLTALDLTALDLPDASGRRVLMLDREGLDVDHRLRDYLEQSGAGVEVAPGPGYSRYTEEPQLARAPREVFATVTAWLSEAPVGRARPRAGGGAGATSSLDLPPQDPHVRETPFTVGLPAGRLFGILAEPVQAPRADLCAVILNPGALRRVGAGRMWVEVARRWAARGVPTLRLDLAGLGDSDGDAERYADTAALYVQELVPQVIEALDELEAQGMPKRFLLVGLCSGANWSFHAALRDERVVAAHLINVRALFWNRSLEVMRDARKARWALESSRWRRLLTGEVPPREVLRVARATLLAPWTLSRQAMNRRTHRRDVEDAFDRLRDARQSLLLVFGEDEPVYDELARDGYLERLERWPNIELYRLPGNNHTFRPLRAQARAHELLDRALERELQRVPGRPVESASASSDNGRGETSASSVRRGA